MEQEVEDIGLTVKDVAEYVTRQQALDRNERAAWRDAQKLHAEGKKRADEIPMAEIQAEAEEKKRADDLQAEEKKRADEIQMAQIKNSRKWNYKPKMKAQANTSPAATPTPRNKVAESPKLSSFIDGKDELESYLLCFKSFAENASWEKNTWAIRVSALLTGRAMEVYNRISDTNANDYDKVNKALLTRYNFTEDG